MEASTAAQEAYECWRATADAIRREAAAHKGQKPSPVATSAAVRFIAGLAEESLCTKQQQLLSSVVRLLETAVYVEQQEETGQSSQMPYYVGSRWLESRLLQLRKNLVYMAEVVRRAQRFENIRVKVQASLMELSSKRRISNSVLRKKPAATTEEEPPPEKENQSLDEAADRFAQKLSAGRSGKSSLIWLWGVWKQVHGILMRRRRKKSQLLEQTLIGDLIAPFRHWMIYAVENRCESKLITYHTYLQERQMYTRTAMDLQNKKEDLVLDLQVSNHSCNRLAKTLESKRTERAALHHRLLEVRPELVKALLSQVLDMSLGEIMKTGFLHKTRSRLTFLTRDLATMLLQDEDTAWKLLGLSGDQLLTRWANHQLSQFKVVANAVLEAMSKRSSKEDGEEEDDIEWSAREIELYGNRCRTIRAMHRISQLDDDQDGALLAVVYGAAFHCQEVAAVQPGRNEPAHPAAAAKATEVHPMSLWPLDEQEAEGRALALCQAIRQVLPHCPGQFLLQPGDIAQGKNSLLPAILAIIFLSNVTLPCSAGSYDLFGASAFAVSTVLNKDKEIKGDKLRKQNTVASELESRVEEPPELMEHIEEKTFESKRRICAWVAQAEDSEVATRELPSEHDPVSRSIVSSVEKLAGPWARQRAQDYSKLLMPWEDLMELSSMPPHDILLRWVNFQISGVPGGEGARLDSLDDLGGSEMLLEMLSRVAADLLPLQAEEQAALRQAHNPSTTETATRRLVVAVSKRCASYHILTEESLRDEQTDLSAAFLAELLVNRPSLPATSDSEIRSHMDSLATIVLEAAKTEPGGLQDLCSYLQERYTEIQSSLRELQRHHKIMESVNSKMRSFALKMLVQRSKGMPCSMHDLVKKVRTAEVRGDLISGERVKALVTKEMKRLPADAAAGARLSSDLVINSEKSALQELLRRSITAIRDTFRHYARGAFSGIEGTAPADATKGRRSSRTSISGEGGQVLVVSQRSFMRLYRDCRLHAAKLTPLDLEEIFNEVRLSHAMHFGQEDANGLSLFEQGLSLEMYVEALLTVACRAKLELFQPTAYKEKLEYIIEQHLSLAGTPRDEFVYALIVDESLDEVLNEFAGRLRSIFTAYAGSARSVERDRRRHRGAMVEVTAVQSQKQAMCMSLDGFTEMLDHAGLLSTSINRARVGMMFRGLQELQRREPAKVEEKQEAVRRTSSAMSGFPVSRFSSSQSALPSPSNSEDPERLAAMVQEDSSAAAFQYLMSFQEFLDGLIVLTQFKEPNPFISFVTRFEKFLRTSFVEPLFAYATKSDEPRLVTLYQALDDAMQQDMSVEGITRKLAEAEKA